MTGRADEDDLVREERLETHAAVPARGADDAESLAAAATHSQQVGALGVHLFDVRERAYTFVNNRLEGNAPATIEAVVSGQ